MSSQNADDDKKPSLQTSLGNVLRPIYQSTPTEKRYQPRSYSASHVVDSRNYLMTPFAFNSDPGSYANEPNSSHIGPKSFSRFTISDEATVDRQRKELQLMINELQVRDKELNSLVHSHHQQLVNWEIDRQKLQIIEKQSAKTKIELRKRREQCKLLKDRLKECESGAESKQHELRTTQDHLMQLSLKANHSSNHVDELELKNRTLKNSVEELTKSVVALQARDQEISTLSRLKEKEVIDANSRIEDLKTELQSVLKTLQDYQDQENKHKHDMESLQDENSILRKQVDELKESATCYNTSEEDAKNTRNENQLLQKELFLAGEREKRKDCLLELSHSRQERMEAELNNIRNLYERTQQELFHMKHRLVDEDDSCSMFSDFSTTMSGVRQLYSTRNPSTKKNEASILSRNLSLDQEDIGEMNTCELRPLSNEWVGKTHNCRKWRCESQDAVQQKSFLLDSPLHSPS